MKTSQIKPPVAILGFGVEGKAAYHFLISQDILDITILDEKEGLEIPEGVKNRLGSGAFEDLKGFETILRSPSVYYKLPAILEARDMGKVVTSMTELTLEAGWERLTAVTGSNGKTTTTTMIDKILTAHYDGKIIVGGNDRKPVLEETLSTEWPVLLEVSSFQFADLTTSPHISVILNITPNHMDWHENEEDYIHAKANLITHQTKDDWAVLNAGNENSHRLAIKAPGKVFWLNEERGKSWAVWRGDKVVARFGEQEFEVLSKKDLFVKTHPDNVLAAVAVSLIHGVSPELIRKELMAFKGVEQRLEFVREIEGVSFYNDSACTTPESVIVALGQFEKGKLILLLGGSSKNSDFSFMAHHISEAKARVYLYGAEGEKIEAAMREEGAEELILHRDETQDFEKIIKHAQSFGKAGDSIVLSPACASFDMFKNSKERGKLFKEMVGKL